MSRVSLLYHRYFYRKFRGRNTIHSEEILQPLGTIERHIGFRLKIFPRLFPISIQPEYFVNETTVSIEIYRRASRNCFTVREKSKLNQIWPYDPFPLENVPSISIFWIFIHPLIRARDKSFSKLIAIPGNEVC